MFFFVEAKGITPQISDNPYFLCRRSKEGVITKEPRFLSVGVYLSETRKHEYLLFSLILLLLEDKYTNLFVLNFVVILNPVEEDSFILTVYKLLLLSGVGGSSL